jgi:hypothetical protein
MISCQKCGFSCHFACTTISSYKEFHKVEESQSWICDNCNNCLPASCEICFKIDRRRKIVLKCTTCSKSYHRSCHKNLYISYQTSVDEWVCKTCSEITTRITPLPTNNTVKSIGKAIRIGHINARDILSKSKLNDIKIILSRDNYDVFAVTETW